MRNGLSHSSKTPDSSTDQGQLNLCTKSKIKGKVKHEIKKKKQGKEKQKM